MQYVHKNNLNIVLNINSMYIQTEIQLLGNRRFFPCTHCKRLFSASGLYIEHYHKTYRHQLYIINFILYENHSQ